MTGLSVRIFLNSYFHRNSSVDRVDAIQTQQNPGSRTDLPYQTAEQYIPIRRRSLYSLLTLSFFWSFSLRFCIVAERRSVTSDVIWAATWQSKKSDTCAQRRLRSACVGSFPPRPLGIGMHIQTLLSPLLKVPRMVLLSSLLWWELGPNLPGHAPGEWLSFWRATSKHFWCESTG